MQQPNQDRPEKLQEKSNKSSVSVILTNQKNLSTISVLARLGSVSDLDSEPLAREETFRVNQSELRSVQSELSGRNMSEKFQDWKNSIVELPSLVKKFNPILISNEKTRGTLTNLKDKRKKRTRRSKVQERNLFFKTEDKPSLTEFQRIMSSLGNVNRDSRTSLQTPKLNMKSSVSIPFKESLVMISKNRNKSQIFSLQKEMSKKGDLKIAKDCRKAQKVKIGRISKKIRKAWRLKSQMAMNVFKKTMWLKPELDSKDPSLDKPHTRFFMVGTTGNIVRSKDEVFQTTESNPSKKKINRAVSFVDLKEVEKLPVPPNTRKRSFQIGVCQEAKLWQNYIWEEIKKNKVKKQPRRKKSSDVFSFGGIREIVPKTPKTKLVYVVEFLDYSLKNINKDSSK